MAKVSMSDFLASYREIESLMVQLGCPDGFRGAEEWCEKNGRDDAKSRLRMCRMMRNFAVHTPGGSEFLAQPTVRMSYLDDVRKACLKQLDTVQKHLDRSPKSFCFETETASDVVSRMIPRKMTHILVVTGEKRALDVLSVFELTEAALQSKAHKVRKILAAHKPAQLVCVSQDALWGSVPRGDVVFCTKDGTPDMPVLGIVKR